MFEFLHFLQKQAEFFLSPYGIVVFILLYAIWVSFLLPGSWLTMFSGLLYGKYTGSSIVFFGAVLGAILTFFSGRTFLRDWAEKKIALFPKIRILEQILSREGFKLILLTRLSPLFPFGLLNLSYGISKVSAKDFILGLIGILPGTFVYCSIGSLAGDIAQFKIILSNQDQRISFAFTLIGFLATLGVFVFVIRATKIALSDFES